MIRRHLVLVAAPLVAAFVASVAVASVPTPPDLRVSFIRGHELVVRDLVTNQEHVLAGNARPEVAWSADGELLSAGSRIVNGPRLPSQPVWAPTGEEAAYVTAKGGVAIWSPDGRQTVVPDGWGATTIAWSDDGRLAIGRSACRATCRFARDRGVWVWNGKHIRPRFRLPSGRSAPSPFTALGGAPMPFTWTADGRVAWWSWPNSGSIAADGVAVYADRTRIGEMLIYRDYVARCGSRLALALGGDRYATHGKRIALDGRDVSRDPTRSWVSPSCSTDGSMLVAAAGRNWEESRFGLEHRALWQLVPRRMQLTHPPRGWTDESPTVLRDGSILFVRTREASRRRNGEWFVTFRARLERLAEGKLTFIANLGLRGSEESVLGDGNYYGHYGWPGRFAVAP
jgi:hypothetical protein